MKSTGICPKCGCKEILDPGRKVEVIGLPHFTTASLKVLVCTECGYTEWYVDKKGLKNIAVVRKMTKDKLLLKPPKPKPTTTRVCLFCNTPIQSDAVICPECGKNI